MEFSSVVNISVIITLVGVAITFFGKNILKARKELCRDWTSEVLEGIMFIPNHVIIPFLLTYLTFFFILRHISSEIFSSYGNLFYLVGILLILLQFLLFKFQEKSMFNISNTNNCLIVFSSILINYCIFIIDIPLVFTLVSGIITFLTLTYASVIYGLNVTPANFEQLLTKLKFKSIVLKDKERVICKIVKTGEDFVEIVKIKNIIDYNPEKLKDENALLKSILINKSEIKSVEDFEKNKK